MNILLALIPISLLLLLAAVGAFLWAVKGGQFDDLDTPALDMLRDDDRPMPARPPGPAAKAADGDASQAEVCDGETPPH